jgi:hypothetical protein
VLRSTRRLALVALALTCSAAPAFAQSQTVNDDYVQPLQEVFQTELVYPQDRGDVQVTVGPRRFAGSDDVGELPVAAEYGITDRWQVEVEYAALSSVRLDPTGTARGHGDVEVGTKYSFMRIGGSQFHAALGLNVSFPSGHVTRGLSEGLLEVEPFVCGARDFPQLNHAQVFAEAGMTLVHRIVPPPASDENGDAGGTEPPAADPHEAFLDVGAFVPIQAFRGTMELNWTTNQWNHGGDRSELYVTPGVVWDGVPGWEFGLGVPIGASHDADRVRVIGMVIFEFHTRPERDEH